MDKLIAKLEATGDYRVLRRLNPRMVFNEGVPANPALGLVVDLETTGLDTSSAQAIEIGAVAFEFDRDTGKIYMRRSDCDVSMLEEPDGPLPEVITKVTGLTDADLRGHRFDDERMEHVLSQADVIIAHNAGFDRPILERRYPSAAGKPWLCSKNDVPWLDLGFVKNSLENIALKMGYFYEAHRAYEDALMTLEVMAHEFPDGKTPFQHMLGMLDLRQRKIWAIRSPFDAKDKLKERGYRWFPGDGIREKCWYRIVSLEQEAAELAWLQEHVYQRPFNVPVTDLTAMDRYSERA